MATSGFLVNVSGLKFMTSDGEPFKDPTAIVNVFRNLKLEPDEIRKIINQNCQGRFWKITFSKSELSFWSPESGPLFWNHQKLESRQYTRLF